MVKIIKDGTVGSKRMSGIFTLDWVDLVNGLVMAVLGNIVFYLLAIFTSLYQLVLNGEVFTLSIDWKSILVVAVFSALTYLSKRLFSNESGQFLQK